MFGADCGLLWQESRTRVSRGNRGGAIELLSVSEASTEGHLTPYLDVEIFGITKNGADTFGLFVHVNFLDFSWLEVVAVSVLVRKGCIDGGARGLERRGREGGSHVAQQGLARKQIE